MKPVSMLYAAAALTLSLGAFLVAACGPNGAADAFRHSAREGRRGEVLDHQRRAVLRSDEAKRALVARVVEGRLTLREAAEEFRRLNVALKQEAEDGIGLARLPEDPANLCRDVIDWVPDVLRGDPDRAARVTARLEAEYRRLFPPGHAGS